MKTKNNIVKDYIAMVKTARKLADNEYGSLAELDKNTKMFDYHLQNMISLYGVVMYDGKLEDII